MHLPKIFVTLAVSLFTLIAVVALIKNKNITEEAATVSIVAPIELEIDSRLACADPQLAQVARAFTTGEIHTDDLPNSDRIEQLFSTGPEQLPIVETVTYTPNVKWLKGRPAWLVDYARHYNTSRYFISRSLAKQPDYMYQKVAKGDQFTVLRQKMNLQFYLLVDISRCKMLLYYTDLDAKQSVLLKNYSVCLGRRSADRTSGSLTPQGKYLLGNRIAVYGPKNMGTYAGKQMEMMRVFGTRWIPFAKEISGCSQPAKGFGIHGMPWKEDGHNHQLVEDSSSLGLHQSDGCIRLMQSDMEELYAIIVTRPTIVEIVKDYYTAVLPYQESSIVTKDE